MARPSSGVRYGFLTSLTLALLAFFLYHRGVFFNEASLEVLQSPYGDLLVSRNDDFHLEKKSSNLTEGLVKRDAKVIPSASDSVWEAAEKKGNLLICYMKEPSQAGDLGTSKWTNFDSLKNWGWAITTTTNWLGESAPGLKELVGDTGPADKTVRAEQNNNVLPAAHADPSFEHPPTNAQYHNNFYPEKGIIVAEYNYGPQICIQNGLTSKEKDWNKEIDKKPDLFQLSDVWWLIWQHLTTPSQRTNLRYVVQHNVVGTHTQEILARALRKHWPTEELPKQGVAPGWDDKKEITPDMDGFAALLGSQSIWGIPWLLIQHHRADQLGHLEVKKITVMTEHINERFYQPNLILELGPVAE